MQGPLAPRPLLEVREWWGEKTGRLAAAAGGERGGTGGRSGGTYRWRRQLSAPLTAVHERRCRRTADRAAALSEHGVPRRTTGGGSKRTVHFQLALIMDSFKRQGHVRRIFDRRICYTRGENCLGANFTREDLMSHESMNHID